MKALRRIASAVLVGVVVSACGGESDDSAAPPTRSEDAATASCSPSGPQLTIVADDVSFDRSCLAAPAGKGFEITLENKETVAHNVAILESHDSHDALFSGRTFTGPRTTTYQVDALAAGTYHFHCSVHPEQMKGTFIVA